jgi:hypothetical protein
LFSKYTKKIKCTKKNTLQKDWCGLFSVLIRIQQPSRNSMWHSSSVSSSGGFRKLRLETSADTPLVAGAAAFNSFSFYGNISNKLTFTAF